MSFWAVVQVESQCEHTVRLLLMRAKYETYMPRIRVHGRVAPLFPGYLFVHAAIGKASYIDIMRR